MTSPKPDWRTRYGVTRRELTMWMLIVGIPALLLVAVVLAVLFLPTFEAPTG